MFTSKFWIDDDSKGGLLRQCCCLGMGEMHGSSTYWQFATRLKLIRISNLPALVTIKSVVVELLAYLEISPQVRYHFFLDTNFLLDFPQFPTEYVLDWTLAKKA